MNMPAYMRKNAIWNTKRAVVTVTQAQQTSLHNADNSLHATSSEYSTLANRMYEFPQQMKITTGNGLQLATERPKEKLVQMFDELQKEFNKKFKEMSDNIAKFMKMHEAEKHKANQLQKNIISENDDIRDNILFSPTTIGFC